MHQMLRGIETKYIETNKKKSIAISTEVACYRVLSVMGKCKLVLRIGRKHGKNALLTTIKCSKISL